MKQSSEDALGKWRPVVREQQQGGLSVRAFCEKHVHVVRRETVKVMFADSTGICMFYKRLHEGLFAKSESVDPDCAYVELDEAAFETLLDGVMSEQATRPRRKPRRIHCTPRKAHHPVRNRDRHSCSVWVLVRRVQHLAAR